MNDSRKNHSRRKDKLPELLKHLAAEFVERESNRSSLITITNTILSQNGQHIKILFTVLPETQEQAALDFLQRKKKEFFEFVDKNARVGRMPKIDFAIDVGEKNRQRIEFLSQNE